MLTLHLMSLRRRGGLFPPGAYFKRVAKPDNPVPACWAQTNREKGSHFIFITLFSKENTEKQNRS